MEQVLRQPHTSHELSQINLIAQLRRGLLSDRSVVEIICMFANIRCRNLWKQYENSVIPLLHHYVAELKSDDRILSQRLYMLIYQHIGDDMVHLLRGIPYEIK